MCKNFESPLSDGHNNYGSFGKDNVVRYLSDVSFAERLYMYESLESTNDTAKAMLNAENKTVLIANKQTAGRGRRGKMFHSPKDSGLYMSVILRKEFLNLEDIELITAMTAVTVRRGIFTVTGTDTLIKWVNDLYIGDKKVCGILTEAINDIFIIGIGINVYTPSFPDGIKATSLLSHHQYEDLSDREQKDLTDIIKYKLAAHLINEFNSPHLWTDRESILDEYRSKSNAIGKMVEIYDVTESYRAYVVGIDDRCRLIVRLSDGSVRELSSASIVL